MTEKYRLIPSADTAKLGPSHYLFDRSADKLNVVYVPTQRISAEMAAVVQTIKKKWPNGESKDIKEIQALFSNPADLKKMATLLASGYIESVLQPEQNKGDQTADQGDAEESDTQTPVDHVEYFRRNTVKHYLKKLSFFNLPNQIENEDTHIGLVGVPISSVPDSSGTIFGPDRLRQHSQNAGFWFDFSKNGVYTEVGCDDCLPSLICKDIVMKDFGNLGVETRTVGELFGEIQTFVDEQIVPSGIRPIFIGGDHSVTFPLVNAFLQHQPSMVLLHLDAHNDLFYTPQVDFNHAGPIHGLLMQSNLPEVYSYGLRTNGDPRVQPFKTLESTIVNGKSLNERVHMHSIGATRRKISNPSAFAAELKKQIGEETPVYLTIDLDVLTDTSMGGQLSTPCGHGLEWHELYECVALMTDTLNIVAADIVEYSINGQISGNRAAQDTSVLLLHTAEGLYKSGLRNGMATSSVAAPHKTSIEKPVHASTVSNTGNHAVNSTASNAKNSDLAINSDSLTTNTDEGLFEIIPLQRVSVRDLDYRTFIEEFVKKDEPVILTDYTDNTAFKHWNFDYFLERVNRRENISVKTFGTPFNHSSTTRKEQPLWDMLATMRRRMIAGLSPDEPRLNIVDWGFGASNPELYDDVPLHPFFANDISREIGFDKHALKWIYFGEPGTGTPTHVDVINSNAWLMLACGSKRWRMVHRDEIDRCEKNGKLVDLFFPDTKRYDQLQGLKVWESTQRPGEIVWTPTRCVHAVQNLEYSIAMTQNYVDLTNLVDVHKAVVDEQRRRGMEEHQQTQFSTLLDAANSKLSTDMKTDLQHNLPMVSEYSENQSTAIA